MFLKFCCCIFCFCVVVLLHLFFCVCFCCIVFFFCICFAFSCIERKEHTPDSCKWKISKGFFAFLALASIYRRSLRTSFRKKPNINLFFPILIIPRYIGIMFCLIYNVPAPLWSFMKSTLLQSHLDVHICGTSEVYPASSCPERRCGHVQCSTRLGGRKCCWLVTTSHTTVRWSTHKLLHP